MLIIAFMFISLFWVQIWPCLSLNYFSFLFIQIPISGIIAIFVKRKKKKEAICTPNSLGRNFGLEKIDKTISTITESVFV